MNLSFLIEVLTLVVCSCSYGNTSPTNETALTHDTLPGISRTKTILISSGQMSPYSAIKIDSCDFKLIMSEADTVYLATSDKKFETREGYKVGTRFSELSKDIQNKLTKESGLGYHYKLSSGWSLGFCEGNSCTDRYPGDSSRVKWIFKRR